MIVASSGTNHSPTIRFAHKANSRAAIRKLKLKRKDSLAKGRLCSGPMIGQHKDMNRSTYHAR